MAIVRKINGHEVLVNSASGFELSLECSLLKESGHEENTHELSLTKDDVLNVLSIDEKHSPISLHWELLDKCNFSCPFCYIVGHSRNEVIRFNNIKRHLGYLIDQGLLFCVLTGGEVTEHPDFYDIYYFLKANGVMVEVLTNGYKINDKLLTIFKEYKPLKVEVSIYSLDNNKLREMAGIKDDKYAETVLNNVMNLKENGINVVCKTFANKFTFGEIDSIKTWCDQNDIKHYVFSEVLNAVDGKSLQKLFMPDYKSDRKYKYSKDKYCFPCKGKYYGFSIDSSFCASPCSLIRLKDFKFSLVDMGAKKALNSLSDCIKKYENILITGCYGCGNSNDCSVCIASATPKRNDEGEIISFVADKRNCMIVGD